MRILDKIYSGLSNEIVVDAISISLDEVPFVMAEYLEENEMDFDKDIDLGELSDFLGMMVFTHTIQQNPEAFQLYMKL